MSGSASFQSVRKSWLGGPCLTVIARQHVGPSQLEVREGADRAIHDDTTMVEDFLELGGPPLI